MTQYNRVLLKLSGEILQGEEDFGINPSVVDYICNELKSIHDLGVEIGIVIGGGNLFRGADLVKNNIDKAASDHIGMLATTMNAIALQDALLKRNIPAQHMSPFSLPSICHQYNYRDAKASLSQKNIVIFSGGTSNPFCTTDLAACIRGVECSVDLILKGTKVDGIYDKDPAKFPTAKKYSKVSFAEVIAQQLKVMDLSAFVLAQENNLPICVFDIKKPGALKNIVQGTREGSIVY